jgi:hypothetical protein
VLMETVKIMELKISYVTAILDEQGCSVVKLDVTHYYLCNYEHHLF